mgnify:CR=1 FL=1
MLRRHILATAALSVAAPTIVLRQSLGQNLRKVKMGSAFTTTTNAAFLMPALLKPEGIDLELVMFPSLVQRMQAVASGDVDIGNGGLSATMQLATKGFPMQVLANGCDGGWMVLCQPSINGFKDLVGKKIAVQNGSIGLVSLNWKLKQEGVYGKVELAFMDNQDQPVPLMRGANPGAAWHAAKIAECGGLCTVNPTMPGIMISVDQDGFDVEPLDAANRCTPETVSAHMLYENSDPFRLVEPGCVLDVEKAVYEALDARRVRVSGSRYETMPYTMKLEGAGGGPFQTFMLVGIEDPLVLEDIDGFLARMHAELTRRVKRALGAEAEPFDISLRPYGWNAVSGLKPPPGTPLPREIGLMFIATARTQDLATQIAKTCNPAFFHMPVREGKEMPSYGFPFSPAEVERGEVYEFHLNHVVATQSPFELVRTRWVDLSRT